MIKSRIRVGSGEKFFMTGNGIFLVILALTTIYPIIFVLSSSLSSRFAEGAGEVVLWPVDFTLATWKYVISEVSLWRALGINVFVTATGTFNAMLVTILLAYPLSKRYFHPGTIIMFLVVFTMILKPPTIPYFLTLRNYGLYNNIMVLILPHTVAAYNLIVMTAFLRHVPQELEESAFVDGATETQILFRIVLPVSKPVLATVGLFYAVMIWNQFQHPLMFIQSANLATLQLKLRQLIEVPPDMGILRVSSGADILYSPSTIKAAAVIFATVPILCVYPFLQRYFIKGVMIGSIKG